VSEHEQNPEQAQAGPPYQGQGPAPYQPPQPPQQWPPQPQPWPQQPPPGYYPPQAQGPYPPQYGYAQAPREEGKTVQTVGYVMAGASLLMPILGLAGLILGIITATKPNRGGHGAAIICLSLVLGVVAAIFWAGVYSSDGSSY